MLVRIGGADGHLQKIIQQEESGFVLAIQQADYEKLEQLPAEAKPFVTEPNPELEEYLRDEALVQSSNTRIMKKALEITQDSENRWQASKAIADWLYKNIAKEMRATIPSALEILNTMKGDCNEHSTLFAAMAFHWHSRQDRCRAGLSGRWILITTPERGVH